MCGGFSCSRTALQFLNILYLLIAVLLMGIAAYAKASAIITPMEIAGGIIASGLFLFCVSLLGIVAAAKHHQVLLFFYIVILFLLFIIQFSVSIACLAFTENQVETAIETAWLGQGGTGSSVADSVKGDAESYFDCCGWTPSVTPAPDAFTAVNSTCTAKCFDDPKEDCKTCDEVIPPKSAYVLEATGGIGLFFSLTEMLGVWLAVRYRNQKDPKANPSQFL